MRYVSFSVIAGSIWAFIVPLSIFFLYLQRIQDKEDSMKRKYQEFADFQNRRCNSLTAALDGQESGDTHWPYLEYGCLASFARRQKQLFDRSLAPGKSTC